MDDRVVSPSVAEFIRRVVPGATVHKLLDEGHFSYFCFCDECHRQIFSTLFGIPQGPINPAPLPSSDVASELAEETTAPDNLTEEEQGKSSLAWSRSVLRISSIDTRPYYYYYYLTQYLTDRRAFLRYPWDKAYIRWTELVLLRKYWRQKHHWMGGGGAGLCVSLRCTNAHPECARHLLGAHLV